MNINDPDRSHIDVLRKLSFADFCSGLHTAEQRRDETAATFDEYKKWFVRLEPYLRRVPALTVDEALRLYRADHSGDGGANAAGAEHTV